MRPVYAALSCVVCVAALTAASLDDDDDAKPVGELTIVDQRGKEVKLKSARLTQGTRHLDWLEPAPAKVKKAAAPRGPHCLEFRTEKSTTYKDGILTFVPLSALRKLDYDHEKKLVTAVYTGPGDKEAALVGSTKFLGVNRLTMEGEADLGDLGAATVKFLGGDAKQGLRGVRFGDGKALATPKGPVAVIVAEDKEKSKHPVQELAVLYKTNGGQRALTYLMFKKTVKIDLAKIAKLQHIESEDKKYASFDYEVTLADGTSHTLTLLEKISIDESPAVLVGLVGRVPAGYQLFPAHTIAELTWEKKSEEKDP